MNLSGARDSSRSTWRNATLWQCTKMDEHEATRDELEALIATLRAEVERLKEELRRLRRDAHEVPPHYL